MFRSVLLATTFLALAGCSSLDSVRNAPAANSSTQSQDEPLEHLPALKGDYFKIASRETGRTYYIYVRFPDGYDSVSEKKYPVIYLLDGDSLFPLLAPTHLFLTYDENLPEPLGRREPAPYTGQPRFGGTGALGVSPAAVKP